MQVRPWQISLLMHCCTTKEAVLCNDPGRDSRYSPAVDGALTGVKVHNTLLVPWMSSSGSCIGVLQVRHLTTSTTSELADEVNLKEGARGMCCFRHLEVKCRFRIESTGRRQACVRSKGAATIRNAMQTYLQIWPVCLKMQGPIVSRCWL